MTTRAGADTGMSGRGRYLWAHGAGRLFDPNGAEYRGAYADLTQADVERVLTEPGTSIAVIECGQGVTFASGAARAAVWRDTVRPAFVDVAGGQGDELPYRTEVWERVSGNGQVLVFRND